MQISEKIFRINNACVISLIKHIIEPELALCCSTVVQLTEWHNGSVFLSSTMRDFPAALNGLHQERGRTTQLTSPEIKLASPLYFLWPTAILNAALLLIRESELHGPSASIEPWLILVICQLLCFRYIQYKACVSLCGKLVVNKLYWEKS